jgi:hypothetical protein
MNKFTPKFLNMAGSSVIVHKSVKSYTKKAAQLGKQLTYNNKFESLIPSITGTTRETTTDKKFYKNVL